MGDFFRYSWENRMEVYWLTQEHLAMAGIAVGVAILVAIPLGIIAGRFPRLNFTITWLAGLGQAIPSLALLGLLMPVLGIGPPLAITVLTVRAILPILINTCAGITGVDPAAIESGRGMGMTGTQILVMVELPLAAPYIAAGIRTAAVHCVSIATLAAFVGAGGLGDLIFQGILEVSARKLLLGVIPAGVLALAADFLLGRLEDRLTPAGVKPA